MCLCVCLICLALILADIRTMPCIQKHAGMGPESRSGLENNVGTLLRPDFLLSLAVRGPPPEAAATSRASFRLGVLFFFFFEETTPFGTDGRPALTSGRQFKIKN